MMGSIGKPIPDLGETRSAGRVPVLRIEGRGCDAQQQQLLLAALQTLSVRPGLRAIVLTGPNLFEGEPRRGARGDLNQLLQAIAAFPLPVIAAIPRCATGPGLELALACSARVAAPTSTFSFPDVRFGRLPSETTFLRLPSLAGVPAAASLLALGRPMTGPQALALGLVNVLTAGPVVSVARRLGEAPAARVTSICPSEAQADLFAARLDLRRQAPGQAAPLAALRALGAAVGLPARRLAGELSRIETELARSDQGAALAYASQARAALREAGARIDLDPAVHALRWPVMREAIHLIDEGATPAQVDRCLESYGFPEGPFAHADRIGLDAVFAGPEGAIAQAENWRCYSATLDLMADAGRSGGPVAPGWYRRGPGATRYDPAVERLIQASAISQRLRRVPVPDDLVLQRMILAAAHATAVAGQRHLGISSEVFDALWVDRLGFPAWKGGPLYQAGRTNITSAPKVSRGRDTLGPTPQSPRTCIQGVA